MPKINRYNGNLVAFASGALTTERTIFGDTVQSDDLTLNINENFERGWAAGVNPDGYPTEQWFNAVSYVNSQLAAYIHQIGVPEYNAAQVYYINSYCNYQGVLYVSLTDNNVGNTPSAALTDWKSTDSLAFIELGYIKGMNINCSGASNFIGVDRGTCSSKLNKIPIRHASFMSKVTNSSFVAGAGNGAALFNTVGYTGWAYVFALCQTDNPAAFDFCIGDLTTIAAIPAPFDDYRRIGCIHYLAGIVSDSWQDNGYMQLSQSIPNPQATSNAGSVDPLYFNVVPDVPIGVKIALNVSAKVTLEYTIAGTTTAPYPRMNAQFIILDRDMAQPGSVKLHSLNPDLQASFPLFRNYNVSNGDVIEGTCNKILGYAVYDGNTTSSYELHFAGFTENIGSASPGNICTVLVDSYISGFQDAFDDF